MITDDQKKEIKKLANIKRYEIRKSKYVEKHLENIYLIDSYYDDFDTSKYEQIKRYTEEWNGK